MEAGAGKFVGGQVPLIDAFSAFVSAANRLEASHKHLHNEVARLRRELGDRNRALASSLAENRRLYLLQEEIFRALPCGVAVADADSQTFVLLNPEAAKILRLSEPLSGKCFPSWLRTAIDNAASAGEHGYENEVCIRNESQEMWLAIRYSPMPIDISGKCNSQIILIIRDITEHKTAEQKREATRNVLALAEVSAILAHEIRNPLGGLELLAKCLIEDPLLSSESKQYVEHIQAGIRILSATVANVLWFHGAGKVTVRPLPIEQVVRTSLEFVRPLALQKQIKLAFSHGDHQPAVVQDSDGLKQVLLNLFCNSLRHTAAGGKISIALNVEALRDGRFAYLEFTDNGSGISSETLPHIFEANFSTTGSSGLGLAVCHQIIEQQGGKIHVHSTVGKGTTFRLEIPVQ